MKAGLVSLGARLTCTPESDLHQCGFLDMDSQPPRCHMIPLSSQRMNRGPPSQDPPLASSLVCETIELWSVHSSEFLFLVSLSTAQVFSPLGNFELSLCVFGFFPFDGFWFSFPALYACHPAGGFVLHYVPLE